MFLLLTGSVTRNCCHITLHIRLLINCQNAIEQEITIHSE